jgi:hypothetical protein
MENDLDLDSSVGDREIDYWLKLDKTITRAEAGRGLYERLLKGTITSEERKGYQTKLEKYQATLEKYGNQFDKLGDKLQGSAAFAKEFEGEYAKAELADLEKDAGTPSPKGDSGAAANDGAQGAPSGSK